tara:strand:- start:19 stop:441 length:423 start_codon:yes stop_codon:yes gene_type:complete
MNFLDNETFGYAICFIFFVISIYMILTLVNNNYSLLEDIDGNVVEGFTASQSDEKAEKISNDTAKLIDDLYLDKYRTNYEDIINNMKTWTDTMLLKSIVSNGIDTSSTLTPDNLKKISYINQLESFKKSCDLALGVLDNN